MQQSVLRAAHEGRGAAFAELQGCEVVDHFTSVPDEWQHARSGGGCCDLSGFGLIHIEGADAQDYLHRRMSANVKALSVGEGCHSLLLQPIGRIIAEMSLHRVGETDPVALTSPMAAQPLAGDLDKFIFTEDCAVKCLNVAAGPIAVIGNNALTKAGKVLCMNLCEIPDWGCAVGSANGATVWALRMHMTDEPMVALASPDSDCTSLWELLTSAGCQPIGWTALNTMRIEAGVPLFGIDHDATWLPTDAGIDASAVDYEKGCFPGQEALAKIKNYSHARSVLRLLQISGDGVPPSGSKLSVDGESAGKISSVCRSPRFDSTIGLCHLLWKAREANRISVTAEDGTTWEAEVLNIPHEEPVR